RGHATPESCAGKPQCEQLRTAGFRSLANVATTPLGPPSSTLVGLSNLVPDRPSALICAAIQNAFGGDATGFADFIGNLGARLGRPRRLLRRHGRAGRQSK